MAYHGYYVEYAVKWGGKKSSYNYQRFFRALYGYTQVVAKSNGRRYVYHRNGVLTKYPFVKVGKNAVIVPDNALQPLVTFLKTGKNPAHDFSTVVGWSDLVKYTVSDTTVDPRTAADAVVLALDRILVSLAGGRYKAIDLLQRVDTLLPDELYSLYYAVEAIIKSPWFSALSEFEEMSEMRSRISALRSKLGVV